MTAGRLPRELAGPAGARPVLVEASVTDALGLWLVFRSDDPGGGDLELVSGPSPWLVCQPAGLMCSWADHLDDPLPHSEPPELAALTGGRLGRVTHRAGRLVLEIGEATVEVLARPGGDRPSWEWLIDDDMWSWTVGRYRHRRYAPSAG